MFTARDMGNYPFYFQEYGILCSIFCLLSGLWDIKGTQSRGYLYVYFKGYGKPSILLPGIWVIVFNIFSAFGVMGCSEKLRGYLYAFFKGYGKLSILLPVIWGFVFNRGLGMFTKINYGDICKFTSRDMGKYPFDFQGYGILCSIFCLFSGLWAI